MSCLQTFLSPKTMLHLHRHNACDSMWLPCDGTSAHGTPCLYTACPLHEGRPTRADAAHFLRGRLRHVTPSGTMCAGQHSFNGGKSGTVLLGPGVHDIQIDYFQVPPASAAVLTCCRC